MSYDSTRRIITLDDCKRNMAFADENAGSPKDITGATQANPCALTIPGHKAKNGDTLRIDNVGGMTELNGLYFPITKVDADHVTLDGVDSRTYTAYTSGGVAYVQTAKDAKRDAILASLLDVATDEIERFIGQPVMSKAVVDILDGSGYNKQYVHTGRIITITTPQGGSIADSVQYRNGIGEWENIVPSADYIFVEEQANWAVELLSYYIFPMASPNRNIRIAFNAGFSPVPGDFVHVCQQMVGVLWDESKAGGRPRLGMNSIAHNVAGASSTDSFMDMDPSWALRLGKYRRLL